MKRTVIEGSSNIAEMGYDEEIKTLEIKFHNGSIYRYWPITPSGWELLCRAESKGKYFIQHIRNNDQVHFLKMPKIEAAT